MPKPKRKKRLVQGRDFDAWMILRDDRTLVYAIYKNKPPVCPGMEAIRVKLVEIGD